MSQTFTSVEQQASYGIGRQIGEQLTTNGFDGLDIPSVQAGLADAFNGVDSAVSMEDLRAAFAEIQVRMQQAQEAQFAAVIEEGETFLAENAKREGVIVTESGLQYEIINAGEGSVPGLQDTVRTHYHGTFLDGNVFDSSVVRDQPAEFPVSGVIAGWTEALQLMPVGAKYKLFVPQHLAYGEQGAGGAIPPYTPDRKSVV